MRPAEGAARRTGDRCRLGSLRRRLEGLELGLGEFVQTNGDKVGRGDIQGLLDVGRPDGGDGGLLRASGLVGCGGRGGGWSCCLGQYVSRCEMRQENHPRQACRETDTILH